MGSSPLGSSVSSSLHHVNPFPDGCFIVPGNKDPIMTGPAPTADAGSHPTRVRVDPASMAGTIPASSNSFGEGRQNR